jgi:type II secretory pathway component PulJ
MTLIELTVTCGLLMVVIGSIALQLNGAQRTQHYATDRAAILDETRASMARMTKDLRQASAIDPSSDDDHLVMTTYVGSVNKTVTYNIAGTNLTRAVSGKTGSETLQRNLASTSIFTYSPSASVAQIVGIRLEVTPPASPDTTVGLTSEVELRNMDAS